VKRRLIKPLSINKRFVIRIINLFLCTYTNCLLYYLIKSVVSRKEAALVKLCFGDFKYREGDFKFRQGDFDNQMQCYEFALDYYRKAVDILTNIMKEEYISKIEYVDTRFRLK
jgi:hypothetical protein